MSLASGTEIEFFRDDSWHPATVEWARGGSLGVRTPAGRGHTLNPGDRYRVVGPEFRTGRARNSDAGTSHAGARNVAYRSGSQKAGLLAVYVAADRTDEEAGDAAGIPHWSATRRCAELRQDGFIEPTGELRMGSAGSLQRVCAITEAGRRHLS